MRTTTTESVTSTTSPPLLETHHAEVVVVGDSIAGIGVVQALLELGVDVILVPETFYAGGQASAAGVSSMDEQDGQGRMASRDVWPYSALVDTYRDSRHEADEIYGLPYYGRDNPASNFDSFGPTPLDVKIWLETVIADAPVVDFGVDGVLQHPNGVVYGIENAEGDQILATHVVDATEFQDLYPLVDGLEWEVASCVQNTTWTAVRHVDSTLYPPPEAVDQMREYHGSIVDDWINSFREQVQEEGYDFTTWGEFQQRPWTVRKEWGYREVAHGYSHINNNATDHPMTSGAIKDPLVRERTLLEAKARTYLYLWYQRYSLGLEARGIATDLGYQDVDQYLWHPGIPDEIEKHFAPIPYVREARTLSNPVMTWEDIKERDQVTEAEGFLWGYMADAHGCGAGDQSSGYGWFPVGTDTFDSGVPGFWPGMLRGSRVDAVVASSVRMQPAEYIGGYLLGEMIAGK